MKNLLIIPLLLSLTACASMQPNATIQQVTVITKPSEATCILSNKIGQTKITSPDEATVNRSASNLEIYCMKGKLRGLKSIEPGVNPNMGGDGLGFIGNLVDLSTGAANQYPEIIRMELK